MRWLCTLTLTTVALLCLAVLPPAGDALAQQKQLLIFTVDGANSKYTQQYIIDVGDLPGHQVRLFEIRRTYPSNAPAVNGRKIVESWTRGITDFIDNNGAATTYGVYVLENGDKFFTRGSAVAVHGPAPRMSLRKGIEYLPALRRAAKALAATMAQGGSDASTGPKRARP